MAGQPRLQTDATSASQRPALTDSNSIDEIEWVLKERLPLYEKGSHISVDTTAHTPDDIVDMIVKGLADHQTKK